MRSVLDRVWRRQFEATIESGTLSPACEAALRQSPSMRQPYSLPRVLANGHVETAWAAACRSHPGLLFHRELLHLSDGGVVTLDWLDEEWLLQHRDSPPGEPLFVMSNEECGEQANGGNIEALSSPLPPASSPSRLELPPLRPSSPLLLMLPGLTGGSEDSYIQHAALHFRLAGFRSAVLNARGTSGTPVLTPRFFSAHATGDVRAAAALVAARFREAPLAAVGWSMGANILTRFVAEEGSACLLAAAVSLCNPFDMSMCNENLQRGLHRLYDRHLARNLRALYRRHHGLFSAQRTAQRAEQADAGAAQGHATSSGSEDAASTASDASVDPSDPAAASSPRSFPAEPLPALPARPAVEPYKAYHARTVREFDEALTAPSFGWKSAEEYYANSGSAAAVPHVRIPFLCIQARDDPIAVAAAVPREAFRDNPNCLLVETPTGGHLGWCSGMQGTRGAPWCDAVVVEWLQALLRQRKPEELVAGREGLSPESLGIESITSQKKET